MTKRGRSTQVQRGKSGGRKALAAQELVRQGVELQRAGRTPQAIEKFEEAVRKMPRHAAALFHLALARAGVGDSDDAVSLLHRAITVDRKQPAFHLALSDQLLTLNRTDEALASARRAASLDPTSGQAGARVITCLDRMNKTDDGLAAAEETLRRIPGDALISILSARLLRRQGDLATARERLQTTLAAPALETELRRRALHELGMVLDKLGEFDQAYAAFNECGMLRAQSAEARRLSTQASSAIVESYTRTATPDLLGKWKDREFGDDRPRLAFLVGFPRSGTTMTEQIMAAHPNVVTSDELPLVQSVRVRIAERMSPQADLLTELGRYDRAGVLQLREHYWRETERCVGADMAGKVFVDKLPLNIMDIGLINMVFPEAKVIVALRDPRDVCLSCFIQDFGLNPAMIKLLTLEGTVQFYDEVMGFWLHVRDMLSLETIVVRYEDTVRDLESQARRILQLLDVPWDASVLAFHERARQRSLSTPSYAAVTEPVHTRAVARWRNYERYFKPHLHRLDRYVEAFGYGGEVV